ncbi:MAG TPA: Maf family protein, partial [Myxococcales bacterium]|nr:Maf family protein [Myxococcales bacterium]
MKLVLCSASPRRRELLERIGVAFSVAPAHIDETQRPGEPAVSYALRMAEEKSASGARKGHVALGADTIVVKGEEVLGKPRDVADAERILGILSGAEHRVITAVAVAGLRAVAVETR